MRLSDFAPRAVATIAIAAGILLFDLRPPAARAEDSAQAAPDAAAGAAQAPADQGQAPSDQGQTPADQGQGQTPAAQTPAPPIRRVGEVAVTATRAERDVLDTPGNINVIDRKAIDQSGARDVPELLRRESGLFVTNDTSNPEGYRVEARGFNNGGGNGSALLVLMDGRRLNEGDSSFVDWSLVHLDRVERIEIVRGPGSALYGDNAMGGVIQIITKDGAGAPQATLSGRFGSYDEVTGSLFAGGSKGPFTASVYADGYTSDGYRQHSDFDYHTFVGKLRWTPTDEASFELSSGYSADDRKRPGTLTLDQIRDLGRDAAQPFTDNFDAAHERWVQGVGTVILAKDVTLKLLPYWRSRSDSGAFRNEISGDDDFDIDTTSWGGSSQIEVDRPIAGLRNRAIGGFEFLKETTDRSFVFPQFFTTTDTSANRRIPSVFVQDELNVLQNVILSGGLRYDWSSYRGESINQLEGLPPDVEKIHHGPGELSPRAALTWLFLPTTSAYASYSRGFRLPNFDESIGFTGQLANIHPQDGNSYEVGLKHRGETLSANLALYWMDVDNEIFLNPALASPQNTNLKQVRHRGVEAWTDWRPLHWLELYGSYTLDDSRIEKDPVTQLDGQRVPIEPLNHGTVGCYVFLPWHFELGANANLVGQRHVANTFGTEVGGLPSYYTLDLTAIWRAPLSEHIELAVLFRVKNVTDQDYNEVATQPLSFGPGFGGGPVGFNPAPGRNYEGGVTVSWR